MQKARSNAGFFSCNIVSCSISCSILNERKPNSSVNGECSIFQFTRLPPCRVTNIRQCVDRPPRKALVVLQKGFGAGEGNRTLVCSLGSCRSAIELRPRSLGSADLAETVRSAKRVGDIPRHP
jgi:hypothetical protein